MYSKTLFYPGKNTLAKNKIETDTPNYNFFKVMFYFINLKRQFENFFYLK